MTPFERCTSPEARACFTRIQKRLQAQGSWRDEFALGLAPTAYQCAVYLHDARELAALEDTTPAAQKSLLEVQLKITHRLARQGLRLFAALPPAALNAQGEDAVIATLCAPLPTLIAPLDRESA